MFKLKRPRAMFEADGGNGGGAWAGDGGAQGGAGAGGAESPEAIKAELEKQKTETARLGKLLNDKAEAEKAREAEEAKKQEEEAKKRGEYEKLYWEQKTQLEELTKNNASASEQLTKYDEYFKGQYETALKVLSKEQQATIEKLLDGKSNFDKASLLPDLLTQFGGTSFWKDPKGGKPPAGADTAKDLLAKGDVKWALGAKLAGL